MKVRRYKKEVINQSHQTSTVVGQEKKKKKKHASIDLMKDCPLL